MIEELIKGTAQCLDRQKIPYMIIGGQAIDEEDVKSILARNRDVIDFKYVEKWLLEFAKIAEHEGILAKFNSLLMK